MRFSFHLAEPADDADIRALLQRNAVPGRVSLSYEREPSYFAGCRETGGFTQTIVARDRESGGVAAIACRAVRGMYVNGHKEEVGYLSQLRVDERFRGRWLVSGGFRFLRELHDDGRAPAYLATITNEGITARGILVERRRCHFPTFQPLAELSTIAIAAGRNRRSSAREVEVDDATEADADRVVAFLGDVGRERQFFPAYDLKLGSHTGLRASDFVVARRGGRICGVLALWDQSGFKQAIVRGYAVGLRRVRPLYNAVMRMRNRPALPAVGERIRLVMATAVCVGANDVTVYTALLKAARHRAARAGFEYVMIGQVANDPLLPIARRFAAVEYRSTLYGVHWDDSRGYRERIDNRTPYVEIATL